MLKSKEMKRLLKKYRFTVLGLVFGSFIVFANHFLDPWDLPKNIYNLLDGFFFTASFVPFVGKRILSVWWEREYGEERFRYDVWWRRQGKETPLNIGADPWFEMWWRFDLPTIALFWGLIGFAVDRLIIAGHQRVVNLVGVILALLIVVGTLLYNFLKIEICC